MSKVDFNSYSAVGIRGCFVDPPEYDLAAYLLAGEAVKVSNHNRVEQTLSHSVEPHAAVRHLLQSADPIPQYTDIPFAMSVETFFRVSLLSHGPRETYSNRLEYFDAIGEGCQWDAAAILEAARASTLQRTKEIEALSAFTRIGDTISALARATYVVRDDTEEVFVAVQAAPFLHSLKLHSLEDYAKDPLSLAKDVNAGLRLVPLQSRFLHEVVYGHCTANFEFARYRKARADCTRLDTALTALIEAQREPLVRALFPAKIAWVEEKVRALTAREEFAGAFVQAFGESAPLRKLNEISRIILEVRRVVVVAGPPDAELGQDELLPAVVAFVYGVNPPAIVTNLLYLSEFCHSGLYGPLFETSALEPLTVLRVVADALPDFDWEKIRRIKRSS
jgi:hypothetical protein